MKRVLSVGQCAADHWAISRWLKDQFAAEVAGADDLDDALAQLRAGSFELVLVNRQLDLGGDGLEVIRRIKVDAELATIPVMLVTNYPEYQQQAVAAGAQLGFGKAELAAAATRARLAQFLG